MRVGGYRSLLHLNVLGPVSLFVGGIDRNRTDAIGMRPVAPTCAGISQGAESLTHRAISARSSTRPFPRYGRFELRQSRGKNLANEIIILRISRWIVKSVIYRAMPVARAHATFPRFDRTPQISSKTPNMTS